MLHLLVQSFLWPTGPRSGVLPLALSEVLDGGDCLMGRVPSCTGMLCFTKSVFPTCWSF